MSKGLDMLRDYIEHDALCMRRRKCCEIEDVLTHEIDALKTENAKLRENNDRLIQAVEDLHDVSLEDELVQLENENAKLRELAKAAWGCVKRKVSCEDCLVVACGCTLATAMRECGIEAK